MVGTRSKKDEKNVNAEVKMKDFLGDEGRSYINSCIKVEIVQDKKTIETASGFFIYGNFIVTNHHVVSERKDKRQKIVVSNKLIPQTDVDVLYSDPVLDLAVLWSPKLKLSSEIKPIPLSKVNLKSGQEMFTFGFPAAYSGQSALMNMGYVSGEREGNSHNIPNRAILNCSFNYGNSGGPILAKTQDNGFILVSVVCKKHIKDFLPIKDKIALETSFEKIISAMETYAQLGISEGICASDIIHFLDDLLKVIMNTQFEQCHVNARILAKYLSILSPSSILTGTTPADLKPAAAAESRQQPAAKDYTAVPAVSSPKSSLASLMASSKSPVFSSDSTLSTVSTMQNIHRQAAANLMTVEGVPSLLDEITKTAEKDAKPLIKEIDTYLGKKQPSEQQEEAKQLLSELSGYRAMHSGEREGLMYSKVSSYIQDTYSLTSHAEAIELDYDLTIFPKKARLMPKLLSTLATSNAALEEDMKISQRSTK